MTLLDHRTKATMIGGIAIVLWALLALFTTEVSANPPRAIQIKLKMAATEKQRLTS